MLFFILIKINYKFINKRKIFIFIIYLFNNVIIIYINNYKNLT